MAGHGPPPKDPEKRVRRNKEQRTELRRRPAKTSARARPLPVVDCLPQTRAWWESWCSSPQAERFTETAWQRLMMLAPLVESYWLGGPGAIEALKEIRLNESLLGATPQDLARLRWDLAEEKPKESTAAADELASWRRKRRVVDPAAGAGG